METADVVVVGAGAAGLACGRALAAAGLDVVALEARTRVGGRLRTMRTPAGEVVELGAQVVHGTGDDDLGLLLRGSGIETAALPTDARLTVVEGGTRWDAATLTARAWPPPWVVERRLRGLTGVVGTVDQALAALSPRSRSLAECWIEQIVGAAPHLLDVGGVAAAGAGRGSGGERVVIEGFDLVAQVLAEGLDVRTGSPVERLRWSAGRVEAGGSPSVRARAAVVTVPPSAVTHGGLRFEPDLPPGKRQAAQVLASCDALVVVAGAARAARRSSWVLLVDPPGGLWRTQAGSRVVTGHIKGSAAAQARRRSWTRADVAVLPSLVDEGLGQVDWLEVLDWGLDPWARGAYSVPVPGAPAAAAVWASALGGTVFFAGEASAGPPWRGLVQGALASARRAAGDVLELLGRSAHD